MGLLARTMLSGAFEWRTRKPYRQKPLLSHPAQRQKACQNYLLIDWRGEETGTGCRLVYLESAAVPGGC